MTLSVKNWNHDWILTGIYVVSLLMMTAVNCSEFLRTGSVSLDNVLITGGMIAGAYWFGRKLK